MLEVSERWFEDWTTGEVIETEETYTLTEASILAFANEYDPQVFHTDPVAAVDTVYGGLIASGWQTGSIMMRLLTTLLGESSMGSPGCDELRWKAPVRPGDVLRLRVTVGEIVPSNSKPDRGVIYLHNELVNQRDEVPFSITARSLIRRNPTQNDHGATDV